ncbi:MAG: AAA family ATPase [Alphaproteobacteria bacterium]|nr:AAA family ATPase [Alphaproteobacteria bacterium]
MTRRLGPFLLEETIGRGGMGRVYRAVHAGQEVPVAVKVDRHPPAPQTTMAFLHEVQIVAALDHPNVVMVLDHGLVDPDTHDPDGRPLIAGARWIAMELAGGGTVVEHPPKTWEEVHHVVGGLLDALAHAHARQVVHLDIKPGNLLLAAEETAIASAPSSLLDARIVLSDFGISRRRDLPSSDELESVGTPTYMAPEQIESRFRDQGPWTDLYACGVVLWELICRRPPFEGRRALEVFRQHLYQAPPAFEPVLAVPPGVEAFCRRLLAKDPAERPAFAAEARSQLDALGPATPHRRTAGRRRSPLDGAGLALFGMRDVPLVGRKSECDALWDAFQDVRSTGRARCVFVSGPSGIGKTRLVTWLAEQAHEQGLAATLSAGHAADAPSGSGLVEVLHRELGTAGLRGLELHQRLQARLGGATVDLRALGAALEPTSSRPVSPAELRQLAIGALLALSRSRPRVLVLDDVHRDEASLHLIDGLLSMQEIEPRPVLVLATLSNEALADQPDTEALLAEMLEDPAVRTLRLAPLDEAGRRGLVRNLLGLEGALADQVEQRTAGNPLFARALIGAWVEQGVLRPSEHGFQLAAGASADVPRDVASVWESRLDDALDGHDAQAIEALEVAATLGDEVVDAHWRGACAILRIEPGPALFDALRKRHLVHLDDPEGRRWRLAHAVLREILVERARSRGRWRRYNLGIAVYMRESGVRIPAARRARHFLAAEVWDEAIDPLCEAINDQIDTGDLRSPRLVDALDDALERLGLVGKSAAWGELEVLRAIRHRARGELDEAEALAVRIARAARRNHWGEIEAKALREASRVFLVQGQHGPALTYARRAGKAFLGRNDPVRAGDCRLVEASALVAHGRFDEAERAYAQTIEALDGVAPERVTSAMLGMIRLNQMRGDVQQTRRWLAATRERAEPLGLQLALAVCANLSGELARASGELETAAAQYHESVERYRALESADFVFPLLNLAILDVSAGRDEAAVQRMKTLLLHLRRHPNELFLAYTHMVLMAAHAGLSNRGAAVGSLGRVLGYASSTGLVDPDLAEMAEITGARMRTRGWADADDALTLAASQFEAAGRPNDAERVRSRIDAGR